MEEGIDAVIFNNNVRLRILLQEVKKSWNRKITVTVPEHLLCCS